MHQINRNRFWYLLSLLPLLLLLVPCTDSSSSLQTHSHRTLHRLVGGHLRTPPELDDTELIITSSAGGGREGKTKSEGGGGEEKKTLSQQVADGKYGLIQNELFSKPVKKPGIISYDSNPEVPKDNINNLGGLNKNDIWLAENHLLVIRGGGYAEHELPTDSDSHYPAWPPIDDYHAPGRQVKLPSNPKVPPPFPVQLTDDGPLQILGTNYSTTLNGSITASPYPIPPAEGGFYPSFAPGDVNPYSTNLTAGETPFPIPPFPPEFGPSPFPMNGSMPPFFASLPPGAAILPPPSNASIEYDDDDPSIYYPPPYSFFYQMDNATEVPPGPLVPGIVLPPPPNFFAPLDKPRKKPPIKISSTTSTTIRPLTTAQPEVVKQIRPTTPPVPPTPNKPTRVKIEDIYYTPPQTPPPRVVIHVEDTTPEPPRPPPPRVVTILPVKQYHSENYNRTVVPVRPKPESVTVLKPVKTIQSQVTSTPRPVYFYENSVKPFKIYGPPPTRPRTSVSSTQIPLKAYYSTSNEIDTNSVVTQLPETDYYTPRTTTKPPRQYYYYEEQPQVNSITTQRTPKQQNYFNLPQEYYVPAKQTQQTVRENYQAKQIPQQQPQPPQYYYRPNRPPSRFRFIETTKKPDTFSIHVARLKQQIHQYYTTPEPYIRYEPQRPQSSPKPVYQFSFQAANYKPQQQNGFRASPIDDNDDDKFRPINKYSVEIQPAIEVLPNRDPYQNAQPYYRQKQVQVLATSTERPLPSKYYTTPRPDYDYEDVNIPQKPRYPTATPKPISQYSFDATPNPLYQPYYTKPEDAYLDDITQKYFTIFGKKIPGQTTPLPPLPNISTQRPNIQIQYAQSAGKEVSLHGDTIVNYVRPRPPIESQAEYIRPRRPPPPQQQQANLPENIGQNLNTEIVQAIPVKIATSAEGKPGSFISYELPGDDGAHFYFLTPQLAQSRDQGAGFYFENPKAQQLKQQQQQQQQQRNSS